MTGPPPATGRQPGGDRQPGTRPRTLAIHLAGTVAIPGCLAAGALELSRALGGHQLSWVYAFEWPLIGGFGVYMWIRLVRERRAGATQPNPCDTPPLSPTPQATDTDPGLVAWQEYLDRLHARDPPGGPPS